MTKVRRFEDLLCWQKGRELDYTVRELTARGEFATDRSLRNQIQDASGSVRHNIAEGQDAGSDAECWRFLRSTRASASEARSEL